MMLYLLEFSFWLLEVLNPISQFAFALLIFIFLPLTIFKRTRGISGIVFLIYSYLFGAIVWLVGFAVTIIHWGGWGLIIGLFIIPGVGVVPIGILGEFIHGESLNALYLLFMTVLLFVCRFIGVTLIASYGKYQLEKMND